MTNNEIFNTIKTIAKEHGVTITDGQTHLTLKEIGIDSLQAIGLIIQIEDKLSIKIPDEELLQIKTLEQLINTVEKLKNN
jgi:acyl carrier protein